MRFVLAILLLLPFTVFGQTGYGVNFETYVPGEVITNQVANQGLLLSHTGGLTVTGQVIDLNAGTYGVTSMASSGVQGAYIGPYPGKTTICFSGGANAFTCSLGNGGNTYSFVLTVFDTSNSQIFRIGIIAGNSRMDISLNALGGGMVLGSVQPGSFFSIGGTGGFGLGTSMGGSYVGFYGGPSGLPIGRVDLEAGDASTGMALDDIGGTPAYGLVLYQGSGEDLIQATAVNGVAGCAPQKTASAAGGDLLDLGFASPGGTFDYQPVSIAAQFFTTGSTQPSVPGYPELHFDLFSASAPFVVVNGGAPGPLGAIVITPGGGSLPILLPPIPAGTSVILQTLVTTPGAMNGAFAVSDGHEIQFN